MLLQSNCWWYFKDTNWKQITTCAIDARNIGKLLMIFQRYKLKANHNYLLILVCQYHTVDDISKIQTESKSQLIVLIAQIANNCWWYFKDTNWKQITTLEHRFFHLLWLLMIFQRYKLKANHNLVNSNTCTFRTVDDISKIQTESKSQQHSQTNNNTGNCWWYFKDTNWKQITTLG